MKSTVPKYSIDNARLTRLVAKAQKGNEKALEEVVNQISGYIYYYSLSLLCDSDKAQDAVQDILLTMLQKLDSLEKPQAFLGWIKIITANYCKTKLSRERVHFSLDEEYREFADDCEQVNPAKSAETEEVCLLVRDAVQALPLAQRECVMLYYFQQMSVREIADTLEVNENTVKSRLYSARSAMKKYLEKYGVASVVGMSPLSLLSHSLISGAETQKNLTIPYTTPAGNVKVAIAHPSAPPAAVPVRLIAVGCAAAVVVGGVGVAMATRQPSIHDSAPVTAPRHTQVIETTAAAPTTAVPTTMPPVAATTAPPVPAGQAAQSKTDRQEAPTANAEPTQAATEAATEAATTGAKRVSEGKLYFRVPESWEDDIVLLCHITDNGTALLEAGDRNERCAKAAAQLYAYDVAQLNASAGLYEGKTYSLSVSAGNSYQSSYALNFTTADLGRTVVLRQNPDRRSPSTYLLEWETTENDE